MAGGKETPRQKMIGMMYLVLTALLALNVSKQIINAFVTLNNNIEQNNTLLSKSNDVVLGSFGRKITTLRAQDGSDKEINRIRKIEQNAKKVRLMTQDLSNFYVNEAGAMIESVEGHPKGGGWIRNNKDLIPIGPKEDENVWLELKPIMDISAKTNYDRPTYMFIGGNLTEPKDRGLAIVDRLHSYRDSLIMRVANYEKKGKEGEFWSYESQDIRPEFAGEWQADSAALEEALKNVNPADRNSLKDIYKILTVPAKILNHGEEQPWVSGQFNHSPVVAAVAAFTSLRSKVFQAESIALGMLSDRVDIQSFNFNKIDPLAFSSSSYINQGDSLDMRVMVAAYDSTSDMKLRYWVNDSTHSKENMKTYSGGAEDPLVLPGQETGAFNLEGQIEVEIKGSKEWKPWSYSYKVGKPTAAVSLPEMLTLYQGYDNKVKVSASGFSADEISASCSKCATWSKKGEYYIARPSNTSYDNVSVNVSANTEGGSTGIGKETFTVTPFPKPTVLLAGKQSGAKVSRRQVSNSRKLFLKLIGSPLDASFNITSFSVQAGNRKIRCTGSTLSNQAVGAISRMQPGQSFAIKDVQYTGTGTKRVVTGQFEIR